MCGIAGFSRATDSSITDGRRFAVASLLAIEDRGPDSTGAAWTRGKGQNVWFHKRVGPASRIAAKLELDRKHRIHSAILHTRWASQGAVNYTNAHPVVAEHVVLVHNGCISNDDELIATAGLERVGEVDSWAIAALLAAQTELGADHPADLLDLIRGDYALAWFNTDDPTDLHLARGIGRPLTLGWTRRGDLVFSSTRQSLQRTARTTNTPLSDITEVKEGTYLRIQSGKVVQWRTFTPYRRPAPVQRPLWTPTKGSPAPRSVHHGITDLYENRPDDWWEEAERLLGDAAGQRPPLPYEWDDPDEG